MLSDKPWRPEALVRLLLGVFICVFVGSLALSVCQYGQGHGRRQVAFYALAAGAALCLGAALVLTRWSWSVGNFFRRVALLLVCFYAGLFLGAWAQKMTGQQDSQVPSVQQMVITAVSFQCATVVLVGFFLQEHRSSWREAFGFSNRWSHALLIGLMLGCIFLPIGWLFQRISAAVLQQVIHVQPHEQLPVQTLRIAESLRDRLVLGIVTIVIAPVAEELLFRGILYPFVKQAGFPRLALWGTALLFAAIHMSAVTFVPLTLLALALALVYERTNNLLAPIAAHSIFNTLNFTFLYLLEKRLS